MLPAVPIDLAKKNIAVIKYINLIIVNQPIPRPIRVVLVNRKIVSRLNPTARVIKPRRIKGIPSSMQVDTIIRIIKKTKERKRSDIMPDL